MIADLKPYPAMKDSGVEWLGEVPKHWDTSKIKGLARPGYKTFVDGDWIESPYITADGIRLIQTGNIGTGEYREKGFRYISEETFTNFGCTEIKPGDVLICRLGEPVARACLAPQLGNRMITSVDVCILKTRENIHAKFLVYSMSSWPYLDWVGSLVRGSTRDRVSRSMLGSFLLPFSPLPEQFAIVRYLDHVDRRIRRYIRAKQKLVKLLEEQKQALIHQIVTRGLDPNVRLKPSGVEWLGDVPEHWRVMPLKWCSRCHSGDGISTEAVSAAKTVQRNIPVIGGNGIMGFGDNTNCYDTVLAIGRVGALCGNVHVVKPPAWITDNALVLSVDLATVSLEFLAATLKGRDLNHLADKTAQPLITGTRVQNERITFPPLPEQSAIALYLNKATADTNSAINRNRRQIELLSEYRTRLIADVVTGKLDVRETAAGLPDEVEEQELFDETDALIDGDGATADDLDTTPEEAAV